MTTYVCSKFYYAFNIIATVSYTNQLTESIIYKYLLWAIPIKQSI